MGKWIDKVCEKLFVRPKCKKIVEQLGEQLCGKFSFKSFLENCVDCLVWRVGWENCVKGKGEKYW